MGSLIYILFIAIFFPFFLMVLLVEKKARLPVIFVLVGMFIAVFASAINGILVKASGISQYDATITLTPITEELLKAFPVLFFAIFFSDKKESLFTASMATGIGFAVLENAYYIIMNYQQFSVFLALARGFGTGLMHGMCTLIIGFGISFVKKRQKLFFAGTFALLVAAITYHSIFNMLVQSEYSVIGVLIPIVTYLPFFIWRLFNPSGKTKKQPGQ